VVITVDKGHFGLAYLSLSTGISIVRLFGKTYDIVHKLFLAYFHKFSKIAYANNLYQKQCNFNSSFSIEIAYT